MSQVKRLQNLIIATNELRENQQIRFLFLNHLTEIREEIHSLSRELSDSTGETVYTAEILEQMPCDEIVECLEAGLIKAEEIPEHLWNKLEIAYAQRNGVNDFCFEDLN